MREPSDAVDGEEDTPRCNEREDEGPRLLMPTQMQTRYQQSEQQRSGQERFQIAVVKQEPGPQGREEPNQGSKP